MTGREEYVKMPALSVWMLWCASLISALFIVCSVLVARTQPLDDLDRWGSYLAGTSAPLAFLWLIVAVILQMLELREQRLELRYTRHEFMEQRSVMAEQASEAKRQADFLDAQTKLLFSKQADEEFATHLRLFQNWAKSGLRLPDNPTVSQTYLSGGNKERTPENYFLYVTDRLYQGLIGYGLSKEAVSSVELLPLGNILVLTEQLSHIKDMKDRLGGGSRAIHDQSRVTDLFEALKTKSEPPLSQLDELINVTIPAAFGGSK